MNENILVNASGRKNTKPCFSSWLYQYLGDYITLTKIYKKTISGGGHILGQGADMENSRGSWEGRNSPRLHVGIPDWLKYTCRLGRGNKFI